MISFFLQYISNLDLHLYWTNQFLEKAIIEIDLIQQKLIVPSKLYKKSPSIEIVSFMSI